MRQNEDPSSAADDDSPSTLVQFRACVVLDHGPTVIAQGVIDLHTAPDFSAALDVAMELRPRIELDMSRITFMDSAGVKVLVDAHNRLGQIAEAIVLRDPSPAVQRVLELAGVEDLFTRA